MRKKEIDVDGTKFLIAELNTAQVEELLSQEPPTDADATYWTKRVWRAVTWSMNNALHCPTKEDPLNESTPNTVDDYRAWIGHYTVFQVHDAILVMSKLAKASTTGEPGATAESTSATSAAA